MQTSPLTSERILNVFAAMPRLQLALVIAFFVFSIVAGNAVFALHFRRVGKPVLKSLFNFTSFPILQFNAREWLLLGGVFVVSMAIALSAEHFG